MLLLNFSAKIINPFSKDHTGEPGYKNVVLGIHKAIILTAGISAFTTLENDLYGQDANDAGSSDFLS